MNTYTFTVTAIYRTDPIEAKTEEEAREIAFNELQYNGEEIDTTFELRDCEEDEDEENEDEEEEDTQ